MSIKEKHLFFDQFPELSQAVQKVLDSMTIKYGLSPKTRIVRTAGNKIGGTG